MYGTKNAAFTLHNALLSNILRQPARFFETTLTGRILARFSNDTDVIDVRLPYHLKIIAPYGFRVGVALSGACLCL